MTVKFRPNVFRSRKQINSRNYRNRHMSSAAINNLQALTLKIYGLLIQ